MKLTAEEVIAYLQEKDPILGEVIGQIGVIEKRIAETYFVSLISSIISQQLSTKVADVIYARFEALFMGNMIDPENLLALDDQTIRDIGVSWSKIKYMKDLATHVISDPEMFEKFDEMSDEEIIEKLIVVKGIGRWTAEMFLIFTLERPDIFSYGDLGLRRAIQRLYGFKKEPTEKQMAKIVKNWIPYRTVASRYLWKSLSL